MLAGILTKALEIIIVLDICGAIVYCVIYGLSRSRGDGGEQVRTGPEPPPLHPIYSSPFQPCPAEGIPAPSIPLPYPSSRSDAAIYAGISSEPEARKGFSLITGLKGRIASLKDRFAGRPASGAPNLRGDHQSLSRILDSFREEV